MSDGIKDEVDHTLSKTIGDIFALAHKNLAALDQYRRTIRIIDTLCENSHEGKLDSDVVEKRINELNTIIKNIYNE